MPGIKQRWHSLKSGPGTLELWHTGPWNWDPGAWYPDTQNPETGSLGLGLTTLTPRILSRTLTELYLGFESNFRFFSAIIWALGTTFGSKATRHFF